MSKEASNNGTAILNAAEYPKAHGQAAILLVESLIHGLIEHQVISVADALEIVDTAHEVHLDGSDDPNASTPAGTLLEAISSSLRGDLPES